MPALSCLISCCLVAASPPSPLSHSTPVQCTSALNSGAKESLALGFMVGFSSLRKDHTRSRDSKINLGSSLKFLGSKITADGDCSHEIKRHLLLGRKAMTNLDSVLKSRDIIFLTNVYIVKAMVFPVVMYRCESWTIKKAEHWRIDALNSGAGEDSWEPLAQKGNQMSPSKRKSTLNIQWKDWSWSSKDWWQEEKGMTEDEMVGWHHQVNEHEFQQTPGDSEGQGSLVCYSPGSRKELDMTEWLDNKFGGKWHAFHNFFRI